MPHASHRLDVLLVLPAVPSDATMDACLARLADSSPIVGGHAAHRFDVPEQDGFWSNHQGGFRVQCPNGGSNVVGAFNSALRAWRAGGENKVACPACGASHRLRELRFLPAAAFGKTALVLADVASIDWEPGARAALEGLLGPWTRVLRRVG